MAKAKLTKNQKEWVKALRSGKYKQTRDKLKSRSGAYCCLGVVEVLAESPCQYDRGAYYFGPEDESDDTNLSAIGKSWLGVTGDNPFLNVPLGHELLSGAGWRPSVIDLNDLKHFTFKQIADLVEEFGLTDEHLP